MPVLVVTELPKVAKPFAAQVEVKLMVVGAAV